MEDQIAFSEKTKKILLVEDHLGDEILFKNACQGWLNNYEIECASSINKALQKLESAHYDIIFTDLNTSDSVGPSPVHDLRKKNPDTPIIVLTGIATNLTREECKKAGANGFMVKAELTGQAVSKLLETLDII